jgi:Transcription elongation factor, GreA/GreB, C-term
VVCDRPAPQIGLKVKGRAKVKDKNARTTECVWVALNPHSFYEEANISRGFISVPAPRGIVLLGRKRGDVVEAKVSGGIRRLKVEQVRSASQMTKKRVTLDRSTRRELRLGQSTPGATLAA